MNTQALANTIDHTLLKPNAQEQDVLKAAEEAQNWGCASLCIHPNWIVTVAKNFPKLPITTVVGFPLGLSSVPSKLAEAKKCLADGAHEIDYVMNPIWLTNPEKRSWDALIDELYQLLQLKANAVKAIVETSLLNQEQKTKSAKILRFVVDQHPEMIPEVYLKTSTGFQGGGATVEDMKLFHQALFKNGPSPKLKIKASGGIKTRQDALNLLNAGAHRLGTSQTRAILLTP